MKKPQPRPFDEAGVLVVCRVSSQGCNSGDGDGHVAARGLGVGAQLVGALDEGLGAVEVDAGDEHFDVGGQGEGVALGAQPDRGAYQGVLLSMPISLAARPMAPWKQAP